MVSRPITTAPSSSLIEKRRRRKAQQGDGAGGHVSRQGFVFDVNDEEKPVVSNKDPAGAEMFVFRVRKKSVKHAVDPATASAALLHKKEKAEKEKLRKERAQQQKEDEARDAQTIAELKNKLTPDQLALIWIMQSQVRRELRKTKKEFATSSARRDIMQLSEKSLQALKECMATFLTECPPTNASIKLPNPENARMRALISTHEARLAGFEKEEAQWEEIVAKIEAEQQTPSSEDKDEDMPEVVTYEPKIAQQIHELQSSVIEEIRTTTTQRLQLLAASMQSVDRLILQAEMKKAKLFEAFHDSAFKGYANVADPKENLRALLKFSHTPTST